MPHVVPDHAPERVVTLGTLNGNKQPIVVLPPAFAKRHSAMTHAEVCDLGNGVAVVKLVNEHDLPIMTRRIKIVRHKGSAWISIPREWLRNLRARAGDVVESFEIDEDPDRILLRFVAAR